MMEFSSTDCERLKVFRDLGFNPKHIYDIGGSNGSWTVSTAQVFPDACYYVFEPLADENPEYRAGLDRLSNSCINSFVYPCALGPKSGRASIGISKNYVGSSVLATQVSDYFPSSKEVEVLTLDGFIEDHSFPYPDLIKMDTQGYELEILKGGINTIQNVQMILLESWVARSYLGKTPLMIEIMIWLADKNFFLLDLAGEYRNKDGLLYSQDLFFIRQPSSIEGLNANRSFDIRNFVELNLDSFSTNSVGIIKDHLPDLSHSEVFSNPPQEPTSSAGHSAGGKSLLDEATEEGRGAEFSQKNGAAQEDIGVQVQLLQKRLSAVERRVKRYQKRLALMRNKTNQLKAQVREIKGMKMRLLSIEEELKSLKDSKFSKVRVLWLSLKRKVGLSKV